MRKELIEKTFETLKIGGDAVREGHRKLGEIYEKQAAFTGWENYKKKLVTYRKELENWEKGGEKGEAPKPGWTLCHYDTARIIPIDNEMESRRKEVTGIRYALHRYQTETRVDNFIKAQEQERKNLKGQMVSLELEVKKRSEDVSNRSKFETKEEFDHAKAELKRAIAEHKAVAKKFKLFNVRKRNPADPANKKIIDRYKNQIAVIHNGGALGFGVKWDVDPVDPSKVYARRSSMQDQWDKEVAANAKELPVKKK